MKYALKLGKPFGIKISIHWTFLLLIAWIVAISLNQGHNFQQVMLYVVFVLTLFVCVVLHELGHSLTARHYGGEIKSITLLPIGGMANITKMPEKPKEELIVSAAGLIVNIIIAGLIFMFLSIIGMPGINQMEFKVITTENFFIMLMTANLFIVIFNLIPAFPMDGGRMLRAALAIKVNRLKATKIAKYIGQVFAAAFVILGMFYNPFLAVIGIFVFIGAASEYQSIRSKHMLANNTVKDVVTTDYPTIFSGEILENAADMLVHETCNGFIVLDQEKYKGVLTKNDIIQGLAKLGKGAKAENAANTDVKPVQMNESLEKVYQRMRQSGLDILPVFSNDELKGIVDIENIKEFIIVKNALD